MSQYFSNIGGCFDEKAWDFINRGLIVTHVFVDIFKVGVLFGGNLIDKTKSTY